MNSAIVIEKVTASTKRRSRGTHQMYRVASEDFLKTQILRVRTPVLGVFSIAVVSSTSNKFSQRGHLGEGRGHVLGGAGSGDSNLGRCNDDAVRLQYTELEHGGGKPQPRPSEYCPVLFGRPPEIVEGSLVVAKSDRDVSDDEQLERPGELWQRLRLYHKVILQAPSA